MTLTATEYRPAIGDLFVATWGYDQTNVNAYVVVEVTPSGKSVRTLPAATELIGDPHAPAHRRRPVPRPAEGVTYDLDYHGNEDIAPKLHRVNGGSHPYIKVSDGDYYARLATADQTFHETGMGWGH